MCFSKYCIFSCIFIFGTHSYNRIIKEQFIIIIVFDFVLLFESQIGQLSKGSLHMKKV